MGSIGEPSNETASTIPVIDFANWHNAKNDSERLAVAKELIDACRNIGFAQIINLGIPDAVLDEIFDISHHLYNLSDEQKKLAVHPPGVTVHRGWTAPGRAKETVDYDAVDENEKRKRAKGDCKETYDIGSEQNELQPNQWIPEDVLPGFKEVTTDFYWRCHELSLVVIHAIAIGLGLKDPKMLTKIHSGKHCQLRLAHYPLIPAAQLENDEVDRQGSHTDFSTITLLFQDDCGGLQVKNPFKKEEGFFDVMPIKNACVINIGDPLMRQSNDVLMSNFHRVTLPPLADRVQGEQRMTRERYSIVYFVAADLDTMVETFPECVDAEHPVKYESMTLGAYHQMRMKEYFDNSTGEA